MTNTPKEVRPEGPFDDAEVISVDDVGEGWYQVVTKFTVEAEGNEKPVCVAESVGRALPAD